MGAPYVSFIKNAKEVKAWVDSRKSVPPFKIPTGPVTVVRRANPVADPVQSAPTAGRTQPIPTSGAAAMPNASKPPHTWDDLDFDLDLDGLTSPVEHPPVIPVVKSTNATGVRITPTEPPQRLPPTPAPTT